MGHVQCAVAHGAVHATHVPQMDRPDADASVVVLAEYLKWSSCEELCSGGQAMLMTGIELNMSTASPAPPVQRASCSAVWHHDPYEWRVRPVPSPDG